MLRILEKNISNIDLSGRGGAEQKIIPLFDNLLKRVNDPLFDVVDEESGFTYEFKKQKDLQWFDVGKYDNLAEDERSIDMVFLCCNKSGNIDLVYKQSLGDFIDTCCSDPDLQNDGWTDANLKAGGVLKNLYKKMQFKVPLLTRKYYRKYSDRLQLIYSQSS